MTPEEKLSCYEKVSNCETFDELIDALAYIASLNEEGRIIGRNKDYSLQKILFNLSMIRVDAASYNVVTREYGIRQQVIYLKTYGEK